ncbi:MAG TPA: acyltransferase family protein [Kineosporiaceae bacterium]|nr:acyltransferase family protein [Kineosporiaceae bacterium]
MITTGVAGERSGMAGVWAAPSVRDDSADREVVKVFRPDIEGLRAVAILLVVLYHCGVRVFSGGFVGVDVFFVISGFLITSQLVREVDTTSGLAVGRFYARRVMRLLPAAVVVLSATLIAGWWWLPATRLRGLIWDVVAANGYLLNYRLAWVGTDYRTASGAPSPVQHFWSLAVEEQFYLVVPLLVLVTLVWWRSRRGLVLALGLLSVGSLAWSMRSTPVSPVWAYFGAPSRVWELGAGALLALGAGMLAHRPAAVGAVIQWLGLGLIGFAVLTFGEATVFPGWRAGVPVLGAVLVIAGGGVGASAAGPDWSGGVLGMPVLREIGARSYSWYLWHWPVLLIGPYALSREVGTGGRLVLVGVAFGFAALTFQVVERPLRAAPGLRARPVLAGAVGLGLTAGVLALALLLSILPPRISLGTGSVEAVALSGTGSARTKALAQKIKAAATVENLPSNLTPALRKAAADDPSIYRNGCHLGFSAERTPRRCESFGVAKARKTVVLFGDSHAAQWYPALNAIAERERWRLAVFTKGACSAADVMIYLPAVKRAYRECVSWRKSAVARIQKLHPALVVTSSNADGGDPQGLSGSLDSKWTKAWSRTMQSLTVGSTRVIYLNDTPWPKENVPDCLAEHPRSVTACAQSTKRAVGSARRSMMARAVIKAGATLVDPMPWFCSLKTCPVVVGNILVYKDESHISTVYARLLAPLLAERLKLDK